MLKIYNERGAKTLMRFLVGIFILILGITLILVWWKDVAALFRGVAGMILALGGLLVLYSVSSKK